MDAATTDGAGQTTGDGELDRVWSRAEDSDV